MRTAVGNELYGIQEGRPVELPLTPVSPQQIELAYLLDLCLALSTWL